MTIAINFRTERERRVALATAIHVRNLRKERAKQSARGGLYEFTKWAWDTVEPHTKFVDGWIVEAICRHLEAVHYREITRLLVNVPPGSMKSLITNVFFPAWTWGPGGKPGERFLSFSYGSHITERDNERMLMVINSKKYQEMWGNCFSLTSEGKVKVSTSHRGWKFASSVGGVGTGERGGIVLLDDPNRVADGKKVVESTVTWFRETMGNRLNDMQTSAIVGIMQRTAGNDVSDAILSGYDPYVHLMVPMLYEPDRHCETKIGWSDPRTEDGECYWHERFSPDAVVRCKAMGSFAWNSQYQQRPEIRGGGLLPRDCWQLWAPENNKFPKFDYILASLDPAFTSKETNDPSGLTVWGVFKNNGRPSIMLIWAWRKWLKLHGPEMERWPNETDDDYRARCSEKWGLVETVHDSCKKYKVDRLLIEAKASGISVSQEFARLFPDEFAVELVNPGALDKEARVKRVQPILENEQVFYPNRRYAELVIDECALFPKGAHDDLVDSTSMAWWWLRQNGFLQRDDERFRDELRSASNYRVDEPLYPAM